MNLHSLGPFSKNKNTGLVVINMVMRSTFVINYVKWFKIMCITLLLLQIADIITTMYGFEFIDGVYERNPLMAWVISTFGFWAAAVVKFVFVAGILLLLHRIVDSYDDGVAATATAALSIATFAFLVVVLNNLYTLQVNGVLNF